MLFLSSFLSDLPASSIQRLQLLQSSAARQVLRKKETHGPLTNSSSLLSSLAPRLRKNTVSDIDTLYYKCLHMSALSYLCYVQDMLPYGAGIN